MNEFRETGLTAIPSTVVRPPRVKESCIQLECKVLELLPIGGAHHGACTMVVGQIVCAHLADEAFDRDSIVKVDGSIPTVSRLGGMAYGNAHVDFNVSDDAVWSTKYW